jgi:methyl-accepting chemotaxis protein
MNTQIATAAEEQSYAAEEINRNVIRVVSLVQNAAANAKKSSSIASDLDSASRELKQQITHFDY